MSVASVEVGRHSYFGYFEWEIVVYPTGKRWNKWNARAREVRRIAISPLKHPMPVSGFFSDYAHGDPFGARTAAGALKKVMRDVKRSDERQARSEALEAAF